MRCFLNVKCKIINVKCKSVGREVNKITSYLTDFKFIIKKRILVYVLSTLLDFTFLKRSH